jgi:hypothetical protein
MKDLLVLAADLDAELLLKSLLPKIPTIEDCQAMTFDIIRHPQRDPGVVGKTVDLVRPYIDDYRFLLVVLDHEGSGREGQSRNTLESYIENLLGLIGWQARNSCVVIEPELESWLWVNETHLHDILDWSDRSGVYSWITEKNFQFHANSMKPVRPKEAFEAVLRKQGIPRSSSLYAMLGQKASYKQCVDPSFEKFITTIKRWFMAT